jgi:hypothetical protein
MYDGRKFRFKMGGEKTFEIKIFPCPTPNQITVLGVDGVALEHHGACGRENVFPFREIVVVILNLLKNLLTNSTNCGRW